MPYLSPVVREALSRAYPWPASRPNYTPFRWSLDGGGRNLVTDIIRKRDAKVLLEIGVFMGGSCIQWLEASPTIHIVGIDPWPVDAGVGEYFAQNREFYRPHIDLNGMTEEQFIRQMTGPETALLATISNLWPYRDRVSLVQDFAPKVLHDLCALGVVPDIAFLDAMKTGEELAVLRQLWPNCIITGDDWTWKDHTDDFPIRKPVIDFAYDEDLRLTTERATWVLTPSGEPFAS